MLFAILSNVLSPGKVSISVTVRAKLSSPMHDACHLVKSRTKLSPAIQRGKVGFVNLSKSF